MSQVIPKSYSSSISFIKYAWKNLLLSFGLLLIIYFRLYFEIESYILPYAFVIIILLFILGFYYRYNRFIRNSTYTFYDDKIIWLRNNKTLELFYKDIVKVSSANDKTKKIVGRDYITIKFSNKINLSFISSDPNFDEIVKTLKNIFKQKKLYYLNNVT